MPFRRTVRAKFVNFAPCHHEGSCAFLAVLRWEPSWGVPLPFVCGRSTLAVHGQVGARRHASRSLDALACLPLAQMYGTQLQGGQALACSEQSSFTSKPGRHTPAHTDRYVFIWP